MEQKTNCDLCGSTKLGLLYKLSGFNIRQCNECGLVFRDVILNEQETKRLYGEHYFQDEQKDYFFVNIDYKKKIFASKLRRVEHFYPGKGKLLDIGCAIGTFLLIARESGWEVKGVEVSEFASEYARKNFNLDVLTGELGAQGLEENYFDVITLWDSVDHTERPQAVLDNVMKLLKPGGLVVVETTMEDSLLYRMAHHIHNISGGIIRLPASRCHPMHHSTYYSTKTICTAFERCGFSVIAQEHSDLAPELINTNKFMQWTLKGISLLASKIKCPLEVATYAKK